MCLLSLDRYMREVELIPSVHAINCARRRERSLVSFELDAQQAGVCAACSGRTRSSVLMVLSSAAFGGRRRPGSALGIQSNGAYRSAPCPRSAITPLVSRCSRVESTAVASALAILSVSRSTSNREMSSRHLVLERTSLDGCPGSAWMWGRKSFMHNTQRYF